MTVSVDFQTTRMPLRAGAGQIPALGFGTLIPGAAATASATRDALAAGFRHFDCAERYRNEREVGQVLRTGQATNGITREEIHRIQTRQRFNYVVNTGSPGFIPRQ